VLGPRCTRGEQLAEIGAQAGSARPKGENNQQRRAGDQQAQRANGQRLRALRRERLGRAGGAP
jgi:hypothetical protein